MRALWIFVLPLILTACGGGGADSMPPPVPFGSVSGTTFDALVVGGTVKVYDFTQGVKGDLLGQSTSDANGTYSIPVQVETRPLLVEMTGGYYLEEAGASEQVALSSKHKLSAVVNYTTGSTPHVSLTTFTHLAAGLAAYSVGAGKDAAASIDEANLRISTLVGLDILSTTPALITDSGNSSAALTPELKYGLLAGSISMWTYKHAPSIAKTPHTLPYTSIDFAQLLYQDVSADGLLDGIGPDSAGNPGQLSFGVWPLGVDVYRLGIGAAIVQMAADKNNKTGLTGPNVLSFAKSYISSTDGIFNSVVPVPFAVPTVSLSTPAASSMVSNLLNVSANVQSDIGISTSELLVDGNSVAMATIPAAPVFSLDTSAYSDGSHSIGVRSTDWGGLSNTSTVGVTFSNVSPTVQITAPASNAMVNGQIVVTGATQSIIGLNKVSLLVDNTMVAESTTNLAAPSFTVNTTAYLDGTHTIGLRATTLGGLVSTSSISVMFANVAPVVVFTSPAPNNLVSGQLTVEAKTQSIVGLSSVDILLDGTVVGAAKSLTVPSYVLNTVSYSDGLRTIGVRATDINGLVTTSSVQVTFNNVAPAVSITAPAANARVSGQVSVAATTQSTNALSSVELLVDNLSIATSTTNLSAPTFPLNTAAYLDGQHTIGVRATNIGGLVSVGSIPLTFLNNPPLVNINTPAANVWVTGVINVAGTAQSASGLSAVELLFDSASIATTANLNGPTFPLNTANYADGAHTVGVRATDVNALVTTVNVPINIDNTPPTSTFVMGGGGYTAVLSGCAADTTSGVLSVTDTTTGSVLLLDANKCWTVTKSIPWSPGMIYPFVIKDKAGLCGNYKMDLNYGTTTLVSAGPC